MSARLRSGLLGLSVMTPPRSGASEVWWMWKRFLLGGFLVIAMTAAATATAGLLEVQNVVDAFHQSKPLKLGGVLAGVQEGTPQTGLR